MDRSGRLIDELKIAEARSAGANAWSQTGQRVRREVRRLRSALESERVRRSWQETDDDAAAEPDSA